MTDELPKMSVAALRTIRGASDAELETERGRLAKFPGPGAASAYLAILDELDRRNDKKRLTPTPAGERRPVLSPRYHVREDTELVERVRAAKRLVFDVTEQVRKA